MKEIGDDGCAGVGVVIDAVERDIMHTNETRMRIIFLYTNNGIQLQK